MQCIPGCGRIRPERLRLSSGKRSGKLIDYLGNQGADTRPNTFQICRNELAHSHKAMEGLRFLSPFAAVRELM